MSTTTLGEKVTYLVTEFSKNPQPFAQAYKARMSFTHMLFDTSFSEQSDYDFIEANCSDRGGYHLLVGEYANDFQNERWYSPSTMDDIIIFAPQSTCSTTLQYQEVFTETRIKEVFEFINKDYTEEELFQYSTVLPQKALETLELFIYLKMNCTVPFRMNLMSFNIDTAVEGYKHANSQNFK